MSKALLFVAALSSITVVSAQPSAVSGPVQGYTFDAPTRTIRQVIGYFGSASFGPAVLQQVDFASTAPGQDYAIALRGRQAIFVSGLGSSVSISTLPAFSSVPEGVVWSDDGSVAVVYSKAGNWIQAFTGLPGSVNPGTPISVAPLGGSLSVVATDAHGALIAIGITGQNAGVFEVSNSQFSPLLSLSNPTALAFSQDSNALYAVDGTSNQLSEVDLGSLGVQTWPLTVDDAVAIRAARDASNRKVIYVAGGSSRLLLAYDDASHETLASVSLSFDPVTIQPLGTNGFVLRPRSAGSDPLWSFSNTAQPMVYFVPAMPIQPVRREVRH
jgi:hypothetical protein